MWKTLIAALSAAVACTGRLYSFDTSGADCNLGALPPRGAKVSRSGGLSLMTVAEDRVLYLRPGVNICNQD